MLAQLLLGLTLSAVGLSLSGKLEPVLLFAYFRTPEEALHLAWSEDARTWHPLNQNRPVYRTPFEGSCLRDPFLVRGPEGFFHLLYTGGWSGKQCAYARSEDLVHWEQAKVLPLMEKVPACKNI